MPTEISGSTGVNKIQDGTVVNADIDTLDASKLTGTVADARISSLTASKLTGALPAISAASLTGLTSAQMPAGSIKKVYAANDVTMINGGTSPSNILNSGNGVQVTLQSTSSDVLIFASGNASKSYNGNDNYSTDIHVSGGNLGSGLVTDDEDATESANQKVINNLCQNIPDDEVTHWSFIAYDSAPGSTTPTYDFIRNGTPVVTFTFTNVDVTILEILN